MRAKHVASVVRLLLIANYVWVVCRCMLTSWAVFRVGIISAFTAGLLWQKKFPDNDTKAAENLNDSKK